MATAVVVDIEASNVPAGDADVANHTSSVGMFGSLKSSSKNVGATVAFKDLKYSLLIKKQKGAPAYNKEILKGISGIAYPGEVFAILGSSGAGKTTLLDILASRKTQGQISGDILINGYPLNHNFKYASAYVMQDDILLGSLTTRESIEYTAKLRHPSFPKATIDDLVSGLLKDMALEHVADTFVGDENRRGISGGEKKRLAIAMQLLANPSVLFLDEPTTGLDAFNSVAVMTRVQAVAKLQGRTIICSIHQPRYSIFELFGRVMILSRGDVAYHGPSMLALDVFAKLGHVCPPHENPADYLIDVIVSCENDSDQSKRDAIVNENVKQVKAIDFGGSGVNIQDRRRAGAENERTTFLQQLRMLTDRSVKNALRNPLLTFVQLFQSVYSALLLGSIYIPLRMGQAGIQNRIGVLFFIMLDQTFRFFSSMTTFMEERIIFSRERSAGLYETLPYFLSKFTVEIPLQLFFTLVFSCIFYFMTGLVNDAGHFFIFYAAICLLNCCAISLITAVGAVAPNLRIGQMIVPLIVIFFSLFGGLFVNSHNVHVYYIWIPKISFFTYTYSILTKNEFTDLTFHCDAGSNNSCIKTGQQELQLLGFDQINFGQQFGILIAMVVGFLSIGYISLHFSKFEKR